MEYQWIRVQYQHKKLPVIRDGIYPQFGGNIEFELFTFFEVCYHLKDWIKADERYSSMSNVEKYINETPALRICADLCNRLKHRKTTGKPRSGKRPGIFEIQSTATYGYTTEQTKTTIDSAFVETERGRECCFKLANECMQSWGEYLKNQNLESYVLP